MPSLYCLAQAFGCHTPPPYTYSPEPEPTPEYEYQPPGKAELVATVMQLNGLPAKFYNNDEFVRTTVAASKTACKRIKKVGFEQFAQESASFLAGEGATNKQTYQFAKALNAGLNVFCPEVL